jgi:hypothetical protein
MASEGKPLFLPDHPPVLPFVYLDWNTVQHLRKEPSLSPLLAALVRARLSGAALMPYSNAHIMDSTADWGGLSAEHRREGVRNILFLDGLTSSWMWAIETQSEQVRHILSREPVLEACDRRGQFDALGAELPDSTVFAEANERAKRAAADAVHQMRAAAADAPHVPPEFIDGLIDAVTRLYGGGLREASATGRTFTTLLAPAFQHIAQFLPPLDDVPPARAVAHLDAAMAAHLPDFKLVDFIASFARKDDALHADDLGPTLLGWLGYHRDKAKDVRRGAPGLMPDQSHSRHALSAAVFLSGERRLTKRISAWAACTERGASNLTWPLILQVRPGDDATVGEAARVIDWFSESFEGAATHMLDTLA